MAKDGTRRGGARAGAGRKPKALTEKINEGISATIIELPEILWCCPLPFHGTVFFYDLHNVVPLP